MFALAALTLILAPAPPADPGAETLALQGATVAVGDGRILRRATVVIRDGTIAAVGTNVAVPKGARVVNASGKFVYPGLIDALTAQGLAAEETAPAKPGAAPTAQDQAGPDGGGFFAHVSAADRIDKDAARLSSWRDAGVHGDILEYGTHLRHLFIHGKPIPLTSRHTELYEQYKDRR